jgi:hypothetical protein
MLVFVIISGRSIKQSLIDRTPYCVSRAELDVAQLAALWRAAQPGTPELLYNADNEMQRTVKLYRTSIFARLKYDSFHQRRGKSLWPEMCFETDVKHSGVHDS